MAGLPLDVEQDEQLVGHGTEEPLTDILHVEGSDLDYVDDAHRD